MYTRCRVRGKVEGDSSHLPASFQLPRRFVLLSDAVFASLILGSKSDQRDLLLFFSFLILFFFFLSLFSPLEKRAGIISFTLCIFNSFLTWFFFLPVTQSLLVNSSTIYERIVNLGKFCDFFYCTDI